LIYGGLAELHDSTRNRVAAAECRGGHLQLLLAAGIAALDRASGSRIYAVAAHYQSLIGLDR
jgi:hypothetical protein